MKKLLLKENFVLREINSFPELLTEKDHKFISNGGVILTGVVQRADTENGNGRIYPREILEREVKNYQGLIKERRAYGELDHPDERPEIKLENVSHRMLELVWKGNEVIGKLRLTPHPTKGGIAKAIIDDDGILSISSRGLGSVTKQGKISVVNDDFQLICFDLVSEPSTDGANLFREAKEIEVSGNENFQINENLSNNEIDNLFTQILS